MNNFWNITSGRPHADDSRTRNPCRAYIRLYADGEQYRWTEFDRAGDITDMKCLGSGYVAHFRDDSMMLILKINSDKTEMGQLQSFVQDDLQ